MKLGHVALDGTKIKANASKHKAMSYERMEKRAAELEAEVDQVARVPPRRPMPRRTSCTAGKDAATRCRTGSPTKKRRQRIREAKAALEAEAKAAAEAKVKERG